MTLITSKTNDRVKHVCRLVKNADVRRESRTFVLEGMRLCCDAAQNGVTAAEVYFTKRFLDKYPEQATMLEHMSRSTFLADEPVMSKMSDTESSSGVLSVISMDDVATAELLSSTGRYVACENISDPANLGAISRTAEALGVGGLLLFGSCCDRFNPKALRASMGALLRLPVFYYPDLWEGMNCLQSLNIERYATVVDPLAESIVHADFHDGSVVFIGNEASGLSLELISLCDRRITIPIIGRSESFNAAAAAAIVLWELMKV